MISPLCIPMHPNNVYHVYNSPVGHELFFKRNEDYNSILQKKHKYIDPITDCYAWSLLPDRFDLIIKIKSYEEVGIEYERLKMIACTDESVLTSYLNKTFSNWLNSFTRSYNNFYSRKGALFLNHLRREHINHENQILYKIRETHLLAEEQGYTDDFSHWPHSSYKSFFNPGITKKQSEIISRFGGLENFESFHQQLIAEATIAPIFEKVVL